METPAAMSDSIRDEPGAPEDEFGLSAVRELLRLISETDITEVKIERGDAKLHIKRGAPAGSMQPIVVAPSLGPAVPPALNSPLPPAAPFPRAAADDGAPAAGADAASGREVAITAPMVGTFYASSSPKDRPFVQVGDQVQVGDTVGIVEAMKIMNEIESEVAGRITRIVVSSGQPVEYGQALMYVEPV
jgi:acetyl-CoA carboxylase biotin carboxyl carrier protein